VLRGCQRAAGASRASEEPHHLTAPGTNAAPLPDRLETQGTLVQRIEHPELLGHWARSHFASQGSLACENRLQVRNHAACEPSQKGLLADRPHRQSPPFTRKGLSLVISICGFGGSLFFMRPWAS